MAALRAAVVIAAAVALPLGAEWTIGGYLGATWTLENSIHIVRPDIGTDVRLRGVALLRTL